MRVSVVIPNYQGIALLPATLASLSRALDRTRIDVEVLVVDDHSTDGGPEFVRDKYPRFRLVRKPTNEGFGATANLGARLAEAPLVYFLNSDVRVHEGFLEPLLEQMEAPERFAAASLNLDERGRVRRPNQVTPELQRGQIRLRGLDLDAPWRAGRLEGGPIFTLFGAASSLLVRRNRFLALGGFSDVFLPYYYEDADLGWRAWRRGWSTVVEPRSLVTHVATGSIASTQDGRRVSLIRKRNRFLLLWRNYLDPVRFGHEHLFRMPLHVTGSLLRGPVVARGLLAALGRARDIPAHRAAERAAARRTDREIFSQLASCSARLTARAS